MNWPCLQLLPSFYGLYDVSCHGKVFARAMPASWEGDKKIWLWLVLNPCRLLVAELPCHHSPPGGGAPEARLQVSL